MNSVSLPKANITVNSTATPSVGERRVLICGQLASDATATTLVPVENVNLLTIAEIKSLFGATSLLTQSILKFIRVSSGQCNLDVLGAAPAGSAVAAVSTITGTGTAVSSSTLRVNILSKQDFYTTVSIASGTAVADAINAIYAAVGADWTGEDVPFAVTQASAGVDVTITATDAGTIGGFYSISLENVPQGLVFTASTFGSGAETPTLTTIFDNVGDTRYTGILWPRDWYGSVSEVTDLLSSRFNTSNSIEDGVAVVGYKDSSGDLVTLAAALNDHNLTILAMPEATATNTLVRGGAITYPEDFLASEVLAYRDTRLTTGANIANIVATNQTLDQIGGMSVASLPLFNTPLLETPQPSEKAAMFTQTQMDALTTAGASFVGKNRQNTAMLLGNAVTTYKTDTQGNADVTFKYLNYVDTASLIREYIFTNIKADFVQSRLTDGEVRPGRSFANARTIKSRVKKYLDQLANSPSFGSLVQSGSQAERFIDKYLTVTIDLPNRTATIGAQVPIVGQLGIINFPITITTNVGI